MQALKRLRNLADLLEVGFASKLLNETLARLASQKLSVAVVGEFKRGKSTFINALLGQEILPAGVVPCSAAPIRVTYGDNPSVRIIFKQQHGGQKQIPIEQLANYVTQLTPQAQAMAARVKEAVVSYPLATYHVDIIDTPGLNDDEAMTEVTLRVCRDVSAVIFIIMPEAPFSGTEGDFLHQKLLLEEIGRVIFVVNAIDRVRDAADRVRILNEVRTRIKESVEMRLEKQFGKESPEYRLHRQQLGEPLVFGLSSYNALQGKLKKNRLLLTTSGFPAFEAALERFLLQLLAPAELARLTDAIRHASQHLLTHIDNQAALVARQQELFEMAYHKAWRAHHRPENVAPELYQSGKRLDEMWTEVNYIRDEVASMLGAIHTNG